MQSCHRTWSLSVKALRGQFSSVGNISTKKEIFCTPIGKLYTSNEFVKNNPLLYSNKTAQVVQHAKAHLSQASNPSLSSATSDSQENSDTFRVVYRYKWIPFVALLSRLKLSMTGISCLTTPPIVYFELYDKEIVENINVVLGFWGFSVATLFIVSEVFRRCLGILYINQDNSKVKLAHLTFWGKRKDVTVSIDDIMPISETNENIGSIYWKMSFYEDSSASKLLDRSKLYITTRYGVIVDQEAFLKIFGREALPIKYKS